MVNKHYNIQKYNKPFYIHGAGGSDNNGHLNNHNHQQHERLTNNPNFVSANANGNIIDDSLTSEQNSNLDPICEERGDMYRDRQRFSPQKLGSNNNNDDNHVNYDRVAANDRNMSINAIGRFQYILQMDKELVSFNLYY